MSKPTAERKHRQELKRKRMRKVLRCLGIRGYDNRKTKMPQGMGSKAKSGHCLPQDPGNFIPDKSTTKAVRRRMKALGAELS